MRRATLDPLLRKRDKRTDQNKTDKGRGISPGKTAFGAFKARSRCVPSPPWKYALPGAQAKKPKHLNAWALTLLFGCGGRI